MNGFSFVATPWWVNFLLFIPVVVFIIFRNSKPQITKRQLLFAAIFGIAFGFVEASVVIYLRAALGFLPGYMGSVSDIIQQSSNSYQQTQALSALPKSLFTVEFFREAATLVMLGAVAALAATKFKERAAMFLWAFAFWDIFYYLGLWLMIRWPASLATQDVLFLIPVPWLAQVWFPCLISGLTALAIALNRKTPG